MCSLVCGYLLCTTVPVRGRMCGSAPRSRIHVSILKPGTASFLKLNCKRHERIHLKVGADPVFIQKIMFKIFLKLLGMTRTRIRILGSGSIKNSSKMQDANNSGSGHGPDLRIIPNCMRMHLDPDSWIRIQEFLCGPQIRIGSVPYSTDPLLRIWLG
jgi:hypothetical protein